MPNPPVAGLPWKWGRGVELFLWTHRARAVRHSLRVAGNVRWPGRAPPSDNQLTEQNMAEKSIDQKVKDIVVEQLGVNADQVVPEAKFIEDLGADSLDTVELIMALEEEFGIEVPDEEAEKLVSVGDVIRYIEDSAKK